MNMRILSSFLLIFCACAAYGAQIIRGPYIEDPTQSTMVLRWQTDEPSPAWLEYGPAPRCNQILKINAEATQHKAILYGLVPNQDYCYRLYVYNSARDGVQAPVEGSFRTLFSAERKEVHFLAFGNTAQTAAAAAEEQKTDGQSVFAGLFGKEEPLQQPQGPSPKELLAEQMAQKDADFIIHTGDLTASGLNEDADAEFFTPYKDVLRKTPLFIALGANEYGPDRDSRDSQSFVRTNYSRFHDMSWSNATPKYYSFDTANARFIFLDANAAYGAVWAPNIDEKSAQYQWLRTTLAGAAEKWKIVVINAPMYSTGQKGPANEAAANFVPLFERYGVDLVLQGAEADYERTFPMYQDEPNSRGVTYVTLGGGGATPTRRVSSHPSTARFVSAYHYADITIADRKLTMTVYNEQGERLDKLELYI